MLVRVCEGDLAFVEHAAQAARRVVAADRRPNVDDDELSPSLLSGWRRIMS